MSGHVTSESRPPSAGLAASAGRPATGLNWLLLLLCLSIVINYIDRSNLSIAASLIKDELGLSPAQLGMLLSAFFWPYALMQIPAGWLVDRFEVKWVFAVGFLLWSAATAVTGVLHGFIALLVIRAVLGLGESVAIPSYGKIIGCLFHEHSRGFANSAVIAGLALGPALGMLVGGSLVGRFGWRPFFIVVGLAGLVWLVPWCIWMPRRHLESASPREQHPAGIVDILRIRSAWGTCLGQFCINYGLYFLVTWLPFYLQRERHRTIVEMSRLGALVFLLAAISSMVVGKLSDRWIAAGSAPTRVRKSVMVAGAIGLGIFLLASVVAPERLLVWSLALAGIFLGFGFGNLWAITQTLAGSRMVGRWIGVQNFVGNFAGWFAPIITGSLVGSTGHFFWPFVITAAVTWLGALSWLFVVGPVEPVDWVACGAGSLANVDLAAPAPPPH